MNDWSATHYCSGSESGWTMYLDQSYTSDHRFNGGSGGSENYKAKEAKARTEEEEDEEEDLSMVSDASSGPPHYIEDNEELFYNNGYSSYAISASELERKKSQKGKRNGRNQQHSYLDDTASSPVYGYTKANVKEQFHHILLFKFKKISIVLMFVECLLCRKSIQQQATKLWRRIQLIFHRDSQQPILR